MRVRLEGQDHFINRLGRWDDPIAVAKAQAISAEIWRDYREGTLDWSLCRYKPLVEGKKKHRKAALLWNATQHSWVFYCSKKGRVECMGGKTFGNLISALNPALGEAYKRDRWHSGSVGRGHNCGAPQRLVGISTSSKG